MGQVSRFKFQTGLDSGFNFEMYKWGSGFIFGLYGPIYRKSPISPHPEVLQKGRFGALINSVNGLYCFCNTLGHADPTYNQRWNSKLF